jgi:hypothetical protein
VDGASHVAGLVGVASFGLDQLGQFGDEGGPLGGEALERGAEVGAVRALGGFVEALFAIAGGLERPRRVRCWWCSWEPPWKVWPSRRRWLAGACRLPGAGLRAEPADRCQFMHGRVGGLWGGSPAAGAGRQTADVRRQTSDVRRTPLTCYRRRSIIQGYPVMDCWLGWLGGKLGSSKALTRRTHPATILGSRSTSAASGGGQDRLEELLFDK